ncbi:hypothetical protein D8674_036846 [Pyrus ussuriensis x Pyrus communis]|uniref:Uncharacterized protein n=1 Tax=Pyrus ussuriensis x Pyrus communis TaxID=2448454 RepID=A0A5N5G9U1_9ROSA|nr:hypothetical protein D8674_036846 [Pyrus ussuriensis x Pyrus communis]
MGDSTSTPMFAISDGGVSDPAPMISDDAASIDPGHKTIPRVGQPNRDDSPSRISSVTPIGSVPPLLSPSPLLRAIANSPIKPQSNSNASMAAHSNNTIFEQPGSSNKCAGSGFYSNPDACYQCYGRLTSSPVVVGWR